MLNNSQLLIAMAILTLPMLKMSFDKKTRQQDKGLEALDYPSPVPRGATDVFSVSEIKMPQIINCRSEIKDNPNLYALKAETVTVNSSDSHKTDYKEEGILQEKATTILIEVVPELMKFDKDLFTVTAGKKIVLELDNLDGMQHNLLIIKPGTLEKVGAAADAMLRDPKASEKHYVPEIPEVLFATEMLGPNEVFTLNFTAPTQPGDYPYVCTFPGHWRMMNGIMRVVKP